ncbi:MAG TPA: anti-sigma factor [Terriglobia bacterium]|nr:anti-sigma factor [Terriglobia bacterium]
MKPLEEELRNALRRREPPPGFTARVMARVEQQAEAQVRSAAQPVPRRAPWSWFGRRMSVSFGVVAVATAMLALAVSVVLWQQRRIAQERREGEAARAQLMEALRVTTSKLNHVRTKVREATQDGVQPGRAERTQD